MNHKTKTLLFVAILAASLGAASGRADARGGVRRSAFATDKSFGLGIMLGAPTGLSGK